jgi:hypothetical protein
MDLWKTFYVVSVHSTVNRVRVDDSGLLPLSPLKFCNFHILALLPEYEQNETKHMSISGTCVTPVLKRATPHTAWVCFLKQKITRTLYNKSPTW